MESDQVRIISLRLRGRRAVVEATALDEKLILPADLVEAAGLTTDSVLTSDQWNELLRAAQRQACDLAAARLLASREHSAGDLRAKLIRKGHARELVAEIVAEYTASGALDDERYARMIGRSLLKRRPCGKAYLSAHLQRRRVPRNLAERTAEALLGDDDEVDRAAAALRQKWRSWPENDLVVARRKAYNYLARRGFGGRAANQAWQRVLTENQEE